MGVVISDHIFILGGIARYQNISGKMFFFMISTLFEIPINPDQSWSIVILQALLYLKAAPLSSRQFKLLLQIITAAKQTIAKTWKSPLLLIAETKK